jgi:hypothetical protein
MHSAIEEDESSALQSAPLVPRIGWWSLLAVLEGVAHSRIQTPLSDIEFGCLLSSAVTLLIRLPFTVTVA